MKLLPKKPPIFQNFYLKLGPKMVFRDHEQGVDINVALNVCKKVLGRKLERSIDRLGNILGC